MQGQASSIFDENMIKILIGIGAAAIAAVLTALANGYAANRKIKEIELGYQHKLRDTYVENARKAAAEVYIPISIALTDFSSQYGAFRVSIDFDAGTSDPVAHAKFKAKALSYLEFIDGLMMRGADAYLTTELDEDLQKFNAFIRQSADADHIITKQIIKASVSAFPLGTYQSDFTRTSTLPSTATQKTHSLTRSGGPLRSVLGRLFSGMRSLENLGAKNVSLKVAGISVDLATEVLAAPLDSREFEARITSEIPEIKYLIKEVILGSHR
jgi:hypothetical protein